MIKETLQFNEKEYLINQMIIGNPETPENTIADICKWNEYHLAQLYL